MYLIINSSSNPCLAKGGYVCSIISLPYIDDCPQIIMNHKLDKDTPRFDVQLLFDEIGVVLDDSQYRDAISLVDMYHVYVRQHQVSFSCRMVCSFLSFVVYMQYRKFKPSEEVFAESRPKALLQFAGKAILEGVKDRRRKWTWEYFAERRDDRNSYVELFRKKLLNPLAGQVSHF
jgi:vacuolar protein sorting-associated protein 13A/C